MNFNKCEMILSCTLLQYNLYKDSYDDNDVLPLLFDSLNSYVYACLPRSRSLVYAWAHVCTTSFCHTQWHRSWECSPFFWPLLFETILNKVRTFISIYILNISIYSYVCVCRSSDANECTSMGNSMSRSAIGNKAYASDVKITRKRRRRRK